MKLNCKPGDLAVMVDSAAGNEGAVFTCVRIATERELEVHRFENSLGPVWLIDRILICSGAGGYLPFAVDACIRPLRDQDGEDEMLRIAGLPHGVAA